MYDAGSVEEIRELSDSARPRLTNPRKHGKKNAPRGVFALPIRIDTLPARVKLPINKWVLLALVVLVLVMPKCDLAWLWECGFDSDCDDGNPCTNDICDSEPDSYCDWESWCDDCRYYFCRNPRLEDGTLCEIRGRVGVCMSGECQHPGASSDGGV